MPAAANAQCRAAVPEDTATACGTSQIVESALSNSAIAGPCVSHSPRNTRTTASMSSSSIRCCPYGINGIVISLRAHEQDDSRWEESYAPPRFPEAMIEFPLPSESADWFQSDIQNPARTAVPRCGRAAVPQNTSAATEHTGLPKQEYYDCHLCQSSVREFSLRDGSPRTYARSQVPSPSPNPQYESRESSE